MLMKPRRTIFQKNIVRLLWCSCFILQAAAKVEPLRWDIAASVACQAAVNQIRPQRKPKINLVLPKNVVRFVLTGSHEQVHLLS